ncbi:thioredoxin family protein [Alteromonas sp. 1_MG-2023]|uniref:thioredoxin family protein n=1 Tax=Alteromonas sp. 1_MG-2023 TaxID=3062669 RepID=UPI0026E181D3|nr:thioredoxin family protein [Alteromonas sp. 1_MG-2023]MDO6567598.1 thioredoxin family protein [Alteromonas sp. 1_MG-2023]
MLKNRFVPNVLKPLVAMLALALFVSAASASASAIVDSGEAASDAAGVIASSTEAGVVDQAPDAVGEISGEALLAQFPAFMNEYKSYQPSKAELEAVAALEDDTLLILFGTWCHDSEREVPRLLKTLDASGLDVPRFTLFAVDRTKRDPEGIAKKHGLKYTPTFILLRDGEEVGRVVERADTSLTQDLKALAAAAE